MCNAVSIEREAKSVHRFANLAQACIGRALDLTEVPSAFVPMLDDLPRPSGVLAFSAVRHIVISTVCRLELARGDEPPLAEVPQQVLAVCLANSPEQLWERFREYLIRVGSALPLDYRDRRVVRALGFIREHFSDARLSLGVVASVARVSPWHLERLLRRDTGETFKSHLRRRRLQAAERLLSVSLLSIKEVACQAGFASVSDFDRQFKRYVGATPTHWRANHWRDEQRPA